MKWPRRVLLPSPPPPPVNKLNLGLVPGCCCCCCCCWCQVVTWILLHIFVFYLFSTFCQNSTWFKVWPRTLRQRRTPRDKKKSGKEKKYIYSLKGFWLWSENKAIHFTRGGQGHSKEIRYFDLVSPICTWTLIVPWLWSNLLDVPQSEYVFHPQKIHWL